MAFHAALQNALLKNVDVNEQKIEELNSEIFELAKEKELNQIELYIALSTGADVLHDKILERCCEEHRKELKRL